ncbi:MAG: transcription termination factor Rho [Nocardioides sp.]
MLLADLKAMATGMGISGTSGMKKADLVSAIKNQQGQAKAAKPARESASAGEEAAASESGGETRKERRPKRDRSADSAEQPTGDSGEASTSERPARGERRERQNNRGERQQGERQQGERQQETRQQDNRRSNDRNNDRSNDRTNDRTNDRSNERNSERNSDRLNDDDAGSRRNRRRRGRDRDRQGRSSQGGIGMRNEPDTQVLEDDVLVPAAGILDVLDNYAFVRTSGYLPGTDDVYLSLSMVRKYGLRRGDAIVGQVRQPRDGERREKFNPMVRVDTVNGTDPEAAKDRLEFSKLTPLYPNERLRLETESSNLIGRVIDIAAPIGKGQRGLIVSPSKAGKTMIMQSIANSITTNNPECHLMVVLVDERPEEVTDFQRSVNGEVISSTFDRPASDHTTVAELAIERAKRLVELGHDVVVLLDGITRLGRAYNLAAPASGRILSGGVDSAALYPPKKFFGAARNIENGGSLTILATALIESGSKMDEVIFEEFKGTGNMEIRLRRDFADKRLFPAIDAVQSGTRREELLMSKEELAIVWKLRRVLSGLDGQQALELLLERLKKSHSNVEFLMQVQKTTPSLGGDD